MRPPPRCCVLLVEDDTTVREALEEVLIAEGIDVRTAEDGRQALDAILGGLRPCLVLLDLMMPVMDGWQFLEALARRDLEGVAPVLVLTATGPEVRCPAGASATIRKPFDISDLLDAIGRYARVGGEGPDAGLNGGSLRAV
ncbi:response regulator [Myxococcota bacterium]|nr:response regulator [Myxococcota bacterium]